MLLLNIQVLSQRFPDREQGVEVNDTDSEKQRRDEVEEVEGEEEEEEEEDEYEEEEEEEGLGGAAAAAPSRGELRSRLLSTDTIKDESLRNAETVLEQLWQQEDRLDWIEDADERRDRRRGSRGERQGREEREDRSTVNRRGEFGDKLEAVEEKVTPQS